MLFLTCLYDNFIDNLILIIDDIILLLTLFKMFFELK
jgi:hypothetical protein